MIKKDKTTTLNQSKEREKCILNHRKNAIQANLALKCLLYTQENENQFNLKPSQLKIDQSQTQFRIRDQAFEFLNGEGDFAKFGVFLVRKFFQDKIKENLHSQLYIDDYINKGLFQIYQKLLNENLQDYILQFEIFWTLINLTNYTVSNIQYDYYQILLDDNCFDTYSYIIINSPKEIITLLYDVLQNFCHPNNNSIETIISHPIFLQNTMKCLKLKSLSLEGYTSIFDLFTYLTTSDSFFLLSIDIMKDLSHALQKTIQTVSDNSLLCICLNALSNLSKVKDHEQFLTRDFFCFIIHQDSITNEKVLKQTLKVISNLVNSTQFAQQLITILFEENILNFYMTYINNDNNYILREILLILGNMSYYSEIFALGILKHKIFNIVLYFFSHSDWYVRRNAINVTFNILDYQSLDSYERFEELDLQKYLIVNTQEETIKDVIHYSLLCIGKLYELKTRISIEKTSLYKNYLLMNGIEECLSRQVIVNNMEINGIAQQLLSVIFEKPIDY